MTTEQFRPLWLGQAIHGFSQIAEKDLHEVTLAWDYVNDEAVDLEKWKKDVPLDDPRWYDVLIGSIDDIIEYDGQFVIVDKKTTGSIDYFKKSSRPSETHTIQLNHYRVLLEKCRGIDVAWGAIVYIGTKQTAGKMDAPAIIATPLDAIENTIKKIKANGKVIKDAMIDGVIPPKVKNFLCDGYCPYATFCFTDDRTQEK
jgi:CRISPR/Cas system-associated exonuclease Cas4 (RecB family)